MASPPTRSSRRAEGLSTISVAALAHDSVNNASRRKLSDSTDAPPRKRPRAPSSRVQDKIQPKKSKANGDIVSRPKIVGSNPPIVDAPTRLIRQNAKQADVLPPSKRPLHPSQQLITKYIKSPPQASNNPIPIVPTQNGVKNEPSQAVPAPTSSVAEDKRKLRSQEGSRFKSELLSAYFPDYDEVIGNDPKETHFFNLDTPIIVIDSKLNSAPPQATPPARQKPRKATIPPVRAYKPGIFNELHQTKKVDFGFLDKHIESSVQNDQLPDSYYNTAHRRAERLEKSIRNTEKGRAQHERDQVVRLLEGLQGHDWLKVMGVSGITDSKKKDFEPARDYFIKGCEGILEKFRAWREEEKRRKAEKDRAIARAAEQEEEEGEDQEEEDEGDVSDGDPPDYSDVDASAARQLHEEAVARAAPTPPPKPARKRIKVEPPPEPPVEKEFLSFYKKRHLRDAAMRPNRRTSRSVLAWGEPVPDLAEQEFYLPEEYHDAEFLKANARRRRRRMREAREKSQKS